MRTVIVLVPKEVFVADGAAARRGEKGEYPRDGREQDEPGEGAAGRAVHGVAFCPASPTQMQMSRITLDSASNSR